MAYNPEKLEDKLRSITETQESIQSVSQWIMFHKRHAATSAEIWAKFARGCPENKKLGLVYVANEVVQQAKIKQREGFVEAFAKVLPGTITEIQAQVPPQIQDRIKRTAQVWKDRKIFPSAVLHEIDVALNSASNRPPVPPALQELAAAFAGLKSFRPPAVHDAATLKAAQKTVADQLAVVARVQEALDTFQVDLHSRKDSLEANAQSLSDKIASLDDDDEEPSPAIEHDSEPEVYTAQAAQDDDDDDDELEEVDEGPAKRPKLALDPKLASFLASMQ